MTAPDAAGIEAALAAGLAAHRCRDVHGDTYTAPWCHSCRGWAAHVAAALLPVVTQAQAAERERIARAIESVRIVCPDHHIQDCSPLLNGCSVVIRLRARSAEDTRIARADESGAQ